MFRLLNYGTAPRQYACILQKKYERGLGSEFVVISEIVVFIVRNNVAKVVICWCDTSSSYPLLQAWDHLNWSEQVDKRLPTRMTRV